MSKNFVLGFAMLCGIVSSPVRASIIYSVCSGGCTSTSGSYATTAAQPGASGLTFPGAPITFSAANLVSGVYTDPLTGVVITAMQGNGTVDTSASISGGAFVLGAGGANSGFLISTPANTYAFSFDFGGPNFLNGALAVGGTNFQASNYSVIGTSGFVSMLSNSPVSTFFLGSFGSGRFSITDFEPGTGSPSGGDTPEIPTFFMMGSGLIAGSLVLRRRSL